MSLEEQQRSKGQEPELAQATEKSVPEGVDLNNLTGEELVAFARNLRQWLTSVCEKCDPNGDSELARTFFVSPEEQQSKEQGSQGNTDQSSGETPRPHDTADIGATRYATSEGLDLDNLTEEELIEYAKKLSLE